MWLEFRRVLFRSNQWVEKELDLSRYEKYNLIIKFEFISKNGNNIFIDNLRIGTEEVGIDKVNTNSYFSLYPNPISLGDALKIEIENSESIEFLKILDITGKDILNSSDFIYPNVISTKNFKKGIYIIVVNTQNAAFSKRLIIK